MDDWQHCSFYRRDKEEEEEVSDVSEYEVSDRSEAAESDVAAESLDHSRERRRDDYSELASDEEDDEDVVLTRQIVRPFRLLQS